MKIKIICLLFLLGFGRSLFAQTSLKGYIIDIEGTSVILDYTNADIKVGDRLQVFSEPKIMFHPITHRQIVKVGELIATLEIKETKSKYSVAGKIFPDNAIEKLKVGDKVTLPEKLFTNELPKDENLNITITRNREMNENISLGKKSEIKALTINEKINEAEINKNNGNSINRKNIFIGIQTGYYYLLDPVDFKYLNLSFKFKLGCFLSKKFAIIPEIGVFYNSITIPSKTNFVHEPDLIVINGKLTKIWQWKKYSISEKSSSSTTIFFGSGVRYYLGKFFLEPNFYVQQPAGGDVVFSIDGQIGYSKFISKNIAVELSVGYLTGIGGNAGGSGSLDGNVGLSYYF